MRRILSALPLEFRVLYRQFLLRVIDLETLSVQADVVGFLGQFAGLLVMYSLLQAIGAFLSTLGPPPPPLALHLATWHTEHSSIEIMMLVVGLITVISWDATFPDRRDVMVLSPLPVAPHTILFAKLAASGAILGMAILALNCASSFAWSLVLAGDPQCVAVLPGVVAYDDRGQHVPLLLCSHGAGILRTGASPPYLPSTVSNSAIGCVRTISQRLFP